MTRLNSFYLAKEAWPNTGRAFLRGKEAGHLHRVLRHGPGDTVRLFDGQGRAGLFTIVTTAKKEVVLEAVDIWEETAASSPLTLALGWGKSGRRDWILEKCVELGGSGLVFWQAARSQGRIPPEPKDSWRERMVQAAKQCGAARLPSISVLSGLSSLLEMAARFDTKLLLWEGGASLPLLTPTMLASGKTLAVIGPEGGLEEFEAEQCSKAGFTPVTLGDSILRWETAAMHCLSLAFHARQTG